jgi:hypothetical protein
MEQWLRENKEYNLHVQEYYRQWEEQRDMAFSQQQAVLQVWSWTISFWRIEYLICITNKVSSQAYFKKQGILFPQVQLPPLAPLSPPHSWMHRTGHASTEVWQTWLIIAKFSILLFINLNLVTSSYLVNYSSISWLSCMLTRSTKDRA